MRRWIRPTLALITLAAALPAQAAKPTGKTRPSPAARAALQKVDAIRARAKGQKGEARTAILREAAAGYRRLVDELGGEPVAAASASFAAAELWRAIGELDQARDAYRQAIGLDGPRYQHRGNLELAHLARRAGDAAGALTLYGKVAAAEPKSARAHQARIWVGRVQEKAGKADAALAAYRTAVEAAASPTQKIEACNRLAGLLVKQGQLDAARQAIATAEAASRQPPTGKGKQAERQRSAWAKAYQKMSARRALQRVLDKANHAAKDALEVERNK